VICRDPASPRPRLAHDCRLPSSAASATSTAVTVSTPCPLASGDCFFYFLAASAPRRPPPRVVTEGFFPPDHHIPVFGRPRPCVLLCLWELPNSKSFSPSFPLCIITLVRILPSLPSPRSPCGSCPFCPRPSARQVSLPAYMRLLMPHRPSTLPALPSSPSFFVVNIQQAFSLLFPAPPPSLPVRGRPPSLFVSPHPPPEQRARRHTCVRPGL